MTTLILLTGFLGAGKTTLLRRLLDGMRDRRTAVISNDFGPVNVDTELVEDSGPSIEITDGSMFCSCRQHEFVEGLRILSAHPLDMVLVEASGLGDPANLGSLLSEAAKFWPELRYGGTIGVADLDTITEMVDLMPAVTRQMQLSDTIIANRVDLVDDSARDAALQLLGGLQPDAPILVASFCDVDVPQLLTILGPAREPTFGMTTNTCNSRIPTAHLVCEQPIETEALAEFLRNVAPLTLRIKGFLRSPGGWYEVSCVGPAVDVRQRATSPRRSGLVMIATELNPLYSRAVSAWEAHIGLPVRIA